MKEEEKERSLHIVFLHLDLGIGGAEQLVVNLALASLPVSQNDEKNSAIDNSETDQNNDSLNARVSILTTHCNQSHCFSAVNKTTDPPGILSSSVHVLGSFIPVNILGKGTALCSTVRMMYLSHRARKMFPDADVFVLDVLPTPIPYLVNSVIGGVKCVIYYCHFPDKLLTRDTVNGEQQNDGAKIDVTGTASGMKMLKQRYRSLLDKLEEWAMSYADLICVNSNFTRTEVCKAFPSLHAKGNSNDTADTKDKRMQVLYPAIDLNKFIPPDFKRKESLARQLQGQNNTKDTMPIVSLNRFERKKNIQVLLHAYASILQKHEKEQGKNGNQPSKALPPLVISGGYDPRNMENVEYLQELKQLAQDLSIDKHTQFRPSVSDDERATLLQRAICVVYTPHREHFGIVPLEAMYAGSAVVAIKSGGPRETVVDGVTGVLVEMDTDDGSGSALANAIQDLLNNPIRAIDMGKKGHEHVKEKFGLRPFREEWKRLVIEEGIPRGKKRRVQQERTVGGNRFSLFLSYAFLLLAWYLAKYKIAGASPWKKQISFE